MELINEKQNQITQTRINLENGMKLIIEMDKLIKPKNKYSRGKIYKIIGGDGKVYYGSTCNTLTKRLNGHKGSYQRYVNDKNVRKITSFQILEQKEYYIKLVENFPCSNKNELLSREAYYIENYLCVNKAIPNKGIVLGKKEYNRQYSKVYREDNKEELAKKKRAFAIKTKDHIKEYRNKYNVINSGKMAKQSKEYYYENRDSIKQKNAEVIQCECGKKYTHSNMARHIKSAKHQNYINNL